MLGNRFIKPQLCLQLNLVVPVSYSRQSLPVTSVMAGNPELDQTGLIPEAQATGPGPLRLRQGL